MQKNVARFSLQKQKGFITISRILQKQQVLKKKSWSNSVRSDNKSNYGAKIL